MRIFVAQLDYTVGDLKTNSQKILSAIDRARRAKADIVLFSELAICGYPPEDLLLFPKFEKEIEKEIHTIAKASLGLMVVVGTVRENPLKKEKPLCNSAVIIIDGKVVGYKDKTLLPTYDVFDERRYFEPGKEQAIWEYKGKKIGVLICEDAWEHAQAVGHTRYLRDPVKEIKKQHPDLILALAASPYYFEKKDVRIDIYSKAAKTLKCPLVLCNQIGGNDQLVFDGYSFYLNAQGQMLALAKGFVEEDLVVDLEEPILPTLFPQDPYHDLYSALVLGVRDYFQKLGFSTALVGLSGGIDSAVTACVAVDALGSQNVTALCMPSRYSSLSSIEDARMVAQRLRIKLLDIPIDHLFQQYLDLLSPHFVGKFFDQTEENLQARIRGMILMAISNKLGHVVLSTGNKSEMAMGYTTLYGDMCGGLGVLSDVSKTLLYALARWINRKEEIIPQNILLKPPSAELKPNQTDQDTLPEYAVVDTFLKEYVEEHLSVQEIAKKHAFPLETIKELAERLHLAEYKRRQGPPGIRVTKKAFGMGRRFPIVQGWVH